MPYSRKLGVALSLLCAAICSHAAPAFSQQLREITVGLPSTSLAIAMPRIAKDLGFFAKYGLDPKFTVMENGSVATAALIGGSVNIILAGPGEIVVAQANGQKVIAIATTYSGQSATLVLSKAAVDKLGVKADAPINERLKALNGLIIAGTSPTSAASVAYRGAAKGAGVDLRLTYIGQPTMPAALESGAIQGFYASAPFWITPVTKGTGVAWIVGPGGEIPAEFNPVASSLVLAMKDYVDANPDVIKGFRSAVGEVENAIKTRRADVVAAIAKNYPDIDKAAIETFVTAEEKAMRVKPPTAADMAREIAFVKMSGANLPPNAQLDPAAMVVP